MLWEIVASADWRLVAVASAVGVLVVATILTTILTWNRGRIRKRIRMIETQVSKMQNEINTVLQIQTTLITKLNANSKVETSPRGGMVEIRSGDVAGQTMSPSVAPAPPENVTSGKNGGT